MVFDHSQRTTASQARRNRLKRYFDFGRLKNKRRRVPYKSPVRSEEDGYRITKGRTDTGRGM